MPDAGAGVLITRPEPGASETAARVAALGYQPVVAPLMAIRMLRANLPPSARVQAVLVASGNAVAALPESHRHLPLFAVGEATAARAQAAGFASVSSADGDAAALAALVAARCDRDAGPLLLAAGRGQGLELTDRLRAEGFGVVRRAVYAAVPAAELPEPAHAAFLAGRLAAALLFSAETARHCVRLLDSARLHEAVRSVDALAIGRPAAVALEALPWRRIRVADRPDQDAMLALLR
ncbi:MAG: uroporphyrinogen-III synthase [Acetobacteraceae bacterium]